MRVPHAYESVLCSVQYTNTRDTNPWDTNAWSARFKRPHSERKAFGAERESFAAEGKSLRPDSKDFGAGREGAAPQVRELFAAAGLTVTYLKRTRIGGFRLPRELGVGQAAALEPTELRRTLDRGADAGTSVSG